MPEILVTKEEDWTDAYVAAHGTPDERRHEKWRHQNIKESLRSETQSRCAYCEGFVEDVAFPHVEHIIPKMLRPDLAHRWHNLTTACPKCNIAKDVAWRDANGVLNPYTDDIDAHLMFLGDLVLPRLGSLSGEFTVRHLQLNRLGLMRSRVERLKSFVAPLERWHAASGAHKELLATGIRLDADDGEFTQSVRAFLNSFEFPL